MALGIDDVLTVEVLQQYHRFRTACTPRNAAVARDTIWPGIDLPSKPVQRQHPADSDGLEMHFDAKQTNTGISELMLRMAPDNFDCARAGESLPCRALRWLISKVGQHDTLREACAGRL